MGFIRHRCIGNKYRLYWIVSKRNSIKLHGNTNVKKIEYYLGDSRFYPKYLSWYVWNNDIKMDIFLNKYSNYLLKEFYLSQYIQANYDVKSNSLSFIKIKKGIDLREKWYKYLLKQVKEIIYKCIEDYYNFKEKFNDLIKNLENYNQCIKYAKKNKKDIDEYTSWLNLADIWYENHFKHEINKIIEDNLPTRIKKESKLKIEKYCYTKVPLESIY